MQNNVNLKWLSACFSSFVLITLPLGAQAKQINLYDQPNISAKVIEKIDISAGIVPIFTPKTGDWMKVGDPRNGNTGWIKSSDLNNANGQPNAVTFTQEIINNGTGPHSYQILQYGQPHQMTGQESIQWMKEMQMHQQSMQQSMQRAINDMQMEFNAMQHEWPSMFGSHMPMIMPVVFVPVQPQAGPQSKPPKKVTPAATQPAAATPVQPNT